MAPNGIADAEIFNEFARRSEGVAVGETIELDDLRARDLGGAARFASIALRFGFVREHGDAAPSKWRRDRIPQWTPGWVQMHHEEQWMALFEAAFGYRMASDLWRWKYRHNPLLGMGAWRNGALVAFYGGMTRDVQFGGKRDRTVQIGDVMTRPDERASMTRSGPFQIAASSFIERTTGYDQYFTFGYGFPTDKALKVAQRLGLYEQVDQMAELSWPAADSFAAALDATVPITSRAAAKVDQLWSAMTQNMHGSIVGVRDFKYLVDRYQSHPVNRYECLLVQSQLTGRAKGVIVLRDRQADGVEILDIIGPPDRWPELIRAIQRWLGKHDRNRAYLWTTRSHAKLLDKTQPNVREMELMVPTNVWTPGPPAADLQGKWWLTGGDTDFR